MGGHPHWRGQAAAGGARRLPRQSRRGLVVFAVALTMALGTVLMMIATSSVQAMSNAAVFDDPKADGWVGMAAVGSVLVCALLGMVIVHRCTSGGHR